MPAGEIKIENVAAVLVTAELPAVRALRARGSTSPPRRSAMRAACRAARCCRRRCAGPTARSHALAQGPLSIGGFGGGSGGNTVQVNHLTVGRVPGGALVQVGAARGRWRSADAIAAVAARAGLHHRAPARRRDQRRSSAAPVARAVDAGTGQRRGARRVSHDAIPELMARLEPLPVAIDAAARVVINERTGTVVVGGDVRLGAGRRRARQPVGADLDAARRVAAGAVLAQGETVVVPQTRRGRRRKATRSW